MTFGGRESSRKLGLPVNLVYFRYGSQAPAYYAYNDSEQIITVAGEQYLPIPMDVGELVSSGTLDKAAFDIKLPINVPAAKMFLLYPPGQVVTVIVRQGHLSDPDEQFLVAFTGKVIQCERDGQIATLKCEPVSTSMRRNGLRRNYQHSCPHVLYGDQCRASRADARLTRKPVTIKETELIMNDGWDTNAKPANKFRGGYVEWSVPNVGKFRRTILKVRNEKTIILSGPTTGLVFDMDVDFYLGCNHKFKLKVGENGGKAIDGDVTDCKKLHDNIKNFGGQPWIPTANPINKNPFN